MTTASASDSIVSLQRKTAGAGVVLLIIGYATGGLLANAMTGKVHADVHEIVGAHLNGVLGCFWICALAFTLPLLNLAEKGRFRLVLLTAIPAYMNWLVTTVKSFFFVQGVGIDSNGTNNVVFVLLNLLVVIPSFVATITWAWALLSKRAVTSS